ncbi:adenylyl-sulfate kinase [Candidatus Woesearchaeota archaeon]|nr:adenylyl-sulfate kinase [Candidatus Woesearchaeota archaeon]
MSNLNEGWTVWFTGLHGSGKTTIAAKLTELLRQNNMQVALLDGDEVRKTVSADLGYSLEDRNAHMKRVVDLCKTTAEKGSLCIACVASPTEKSREYAKQKLRKIFIVYVKCPVEVCANRDVKGHYKKAKNNEAGFENFLGVSLKFEEPQNPDIVLYTDKESVEESVNKLLCKLKEKGVVA